MPDLRTEYEDAVRALAGRIDALRAEGLTPEAVARVVHAERRCLAARFKALTPEPLRSHIYARTLATYGDELGPTIESLRAEGKSWEEIAAGAARPGRVPD